MTNTELWRQIGKLLKRERLRHKWSWSQVEREGGPGYKTVGAHEAGTIRTTGALEKHLQVFGWRLESMLRLVLKAEPRVRSGEHLALVTAYEETTDAGRAALESLAAALPRQRHTPPNIPRRRAVDRATSADINRIGPTQRP